MWCEVDFKLDITLQSRGAKRRGNARWRHSVWIPVRWRAVASPCLSTLDFLTTKTSISRTNSGICVKTMFLKCFLTPEIPLLVRLIDIYELNYRIHLLRTNNKQTTTNSAIDFSNVPTEVTLRTKNTLYIFPRRGLLCRGIKKQC